jgi:NADH-quinone oxidoreductase subunit E
MSQLSAYNGHSHENIGVRQFAKIQGIIDKHGRYPDSLIPILQEIQEEYRYLPQEALTYVATALGISPAQVYGVCTFYAQFSLEPKGQYVIQVCDGTACHVRGSNPILGWIQEKLGLDSEKHSTDDFLFTLEVVSCIGACSMAPCVVINGEVYGHMTPEALSQLIDDLKARGGHK